MRIIHTADWHLGRSLHGINLIHEQAHVLDQFVELVKDSKVDVLIVAGDVYDRSLPPAEAVSLLSEVLTRICQDLKVPVIIIAGNHDNSERIGFAQKMLGNQNLHMIGPLNHALKPIVIYDQHGPVHFCPIPYADTAFIRNFIAQAEIIDHDTGMEAMVDYIAQQVPKNQRKVAIAHAFIDGGEESESERPLTALGGAGRVAASRFSAFNYTALGHLHRPQMMGKGNIRYSGSLLKYSFAEAGHKKGITLLEIDKTGKTSQLENIALTPRRDLRCIEGMLEDLLERPAPGENREDYIKVVLHDQGALLDPLLKLRQVYPHVLDLERPALNGGAISALRPERDFRRLSDSELFVSFYEQVSGRELPGEEKKVLYRLIEGFYSQEREA